MMQLLKFLGANPALPVGTNVEYRCPEGQYFQHDWYHIPFVKVKCQTDGQFSIPDPWPICFDRMNLHGFVVKADSINL